MISRLAWRIQTTQRLSSTVMLAADLASSYGVTVTAYGSSSVNPSALSIQ
jgi:hypothetical protein